MSLPRYGYAALYGAAALVFIDQTAELVMSLYPARLADVQWRFGALGLVFGRATTAVIVDVLVLLAAVGLGHRRMVRSWGLAHLGVAVCLLAGLALFGVDALEIRRTVSTESSGTLVLAAAKAAVVVVLGIAYCVWFAVVAVRSAGQISPRARKAEDAVVATRKR